MFKPLFDNKGPDEKNFTLLIFGISFLIVTFLIFPVMKRENSELDYMREISLSDEIYNGYISERNSQRLDRGLVRVTDSIYLLKSYKNCDSLNNPEIRYLYEIKAPYYIDKSKNSDQLIVKKDNLELKFCPF